ncbi:RxLR-like protein [Phytophthora cinnamomi]|uniref:RxLR-like protein n=1 Tax=Phytophthora cinnamomi TaxID=4785 RepID=UPI00355A3FAF|nr:RxLR-like protein [Phytophthora cinnamomi]
MDLEAALTQKLEHERRKPWASWRLALIATIGAVLLVAQFTDYTHHFHAHVAKHRILRSLQEQPALRLTFEMKRKPMYIHGASTFDVVATPAPKPSTGDKSMVYNGMASFEQDGHTHEYSLVDGTAYYTRRQAGNEVESGCLPSNAVPPIASVLSAIQGASTATHYLEPEVLNEKCPGGSMMMFPFAGEDFVLCSRRSSSSWFKDEGFQIFGADLNINVKYESTAPKIVAPRVSSSVLASCNKVPFGERIAPSLPSLMTRSVSEWGHHRALRAEKAQWNPFKKIWNLITDNVCGCKGAKRPCVFIAGLSSYDDYGLTDNDPKDYFGGEIRDHSPCCSSRQYITLATKDNAWYDPVFQQRLVGLIVQVSSTSDPATGTIKDTIIFGHSMANLILSSAIARGKAKIDPSTSWVAASAPMEGSMGSNYIQEACNGDKNGFISTIVDLLGNCPVNTGQKSLAYQGTTFSSATMNSDYAAAQAAYASNVSAVMCSSSFAGLVTIKAALYTLAGEILPHHSSQNDGIVEYASCAMGLPRESFDNTYKSRRYVTELNHVDMSFRNGDGVFSDSKKPVKWFECLL